MYHSHGIVTWIIANIYLQLKYGCYGRYTFNQHPLGISCLLSVITLKIANKELCPRPIVTFNYTVVDFRKITLCGRFLRKIISCVGVGVGIRIEQQLH